ncbi:Altered inheritance of mitochondria protein 32 [Pseudocercospora fuligena]|uniref:Altered inheritance of mitochondria protein 32 n=1 Tax=Pseudocercospora fuligena TaxID=685502 RepID=A0A8H6VKH2_9PEZI|nr:Altered inheritance of mitochondria protein 32 [Pseudocercospora fuligena]
MFIFRHGGREATLAIRYTRPFVQRRCASRIEIPFTPPPVPVIDSCPAPTCQCRESPSGLDIERESNIKGSMASYAEQVLICTGKNDWKSRIEDEEDAVLVRQLKGFLTRGGKYADPYHNVLLTNVSFPSSSRQPSIAPGKDPGRATTRPPASAFLFPSFTYLPSIPTDASSVEAFIKAFILPHKLHNTYDRLTREQQNILLRQPKLQSQFTGSRPVNEILVLICGHGGRDERCGKLGPILQAEFEEKLERQNIQILRDDQDPGGDGKSPTPSARVGLISHIGGHKWAGNVILYIPLTLQNNALAGKGIWYGRVSPENVEGIVTKTVMEGKVIKDLFRGGIDRSGETIRL